LRVERTISPALLGKTPGSPQALASIEPSTRPSKNTNTMSTVGPWRDKTHVPGVHMNSPEGPMISESDKRSTWVSGPNHSDPHRRILPGPCCMLNECFSGRREIYAPRALDRSLKPSSFLNLESWITSVPASAEKSLIHSTKEAFVAVTGLTRRVVT